MSPPFYRRSIARRWSSLIIEVGRLILLAVVCAGIDNMSMLAGYAGRFSVDVARECLKLMGP
jgi:hypothetical protein